MKPMALTWAWWGWEPLSFYRQAGPGAAGVQGVAGEALESWYRWLHEEATVEAAAGLGINCLVTHFIKGFGPEHERAEMQWSAALAEKCHRHGMAVVGYLQYGTLFHQNFFQECPEARDWIQLTESGEPQLWCNTPSRYLPCIEADGFLRYLKRCIRTALTETGLDGIHFDNFYVRPCYCLRCRTAFRQETGAELPGETMIATAPEAPLVRRWTRFRCERLTRRLVDLRDTARAYRPDVLTIWNPSPIRGTLDQRLLRGTDFYELGRVAGLLWSESGNFPEVQEGTPIHQVNFFKTAEAVGYQTFSTVWRSGREGHGLPETPLEVALVTAEAAAFGGVPGTNWLMRPGYREQFSDGPLVRAWKRQIDFIHAHAELFAGSRGCGDVALYFERGQAEGDFASLYGQFLTLQQLLLQKHVFFDLVFSGQEERLDAYPLVISVGGCPASARALLTFSAVELAGGVDGTYAARVSLPPRADLLAGRIFAALPGRDVVADVPETVFLERRVAADGRQLLHVVNYDNRHRVRDGRICFARPPQGLTWLSADGRQRLVPEGNGVSLPELETWALLVWEEASC